VKELAMISSKKAALFLGICLGILLVVLWSNSPTARAQKKDTTADYAALKDTFGSSQVTVFFLYNNPPPVDGQMAAVRDIFGRRYLRITTNAGKNWLIDVERIVAIKQKD
jgi:hypothetical protein